MASNDAAWLAKMAKLKQAGTSKTTVQDMLDAPHGMQCWASSHNVNDTTTETDASRWVPGTPHSVEAFMRLGVDPDALVYRPVAWYLDQHHQPDAAKTAYELCERQRMQLLRDLAEERRTLMATASKSASTDAKPAAGGMAPGATMVELEARRLEVLRRRQAKRLEQLQQHEALCRELQTRAEANNAAVQARQAALKEAKARHEADWRRKKHEMEVARRKVVLGKSCLALY